jgi:predicted alpha/beta superfamily hydrolase
VRWPLDWMRRCFAQGGAALLVALPLAAQGTPAPDRIPVHDSFTIRSAVVGEARPINVHLPMAYRRSPTMRFPVLYMPDGGLDEDFPHVVHTVDSLIALHRIRPVIVVGIPNTERRRDLTGPTRMASDSAIAPHVGESAAFRRFIRLELIPEIDRRYRTSAERSVVGESLAGLFIVETFLLDPTLFEHYVAFDPSLWWNDGAVTDSAPRHLGELRPGPRTLLFASSLEPDIVRETSKLANMLNLVPPGRVKWTLIRRPDLTHGTIFRALAPDALAQALR